MKILKLTAENFKRLSAVEIIPDGNLVMITGKNGQGKSSVLDIFEAALCGGRNLPKDPIKHGQHKGKVTTVLGKDGVPIYNVTRKFFGTGTRLEVTIADETKKEIRSPQAFLDSIVGELSFDPLAFLKKDAKEQRQTILDFLGLNLQDYDDKILSIKAQRSNINTEKKRKTVEADLIKHTPGLPATELTVTELIAELDSITAHNANCDKIASVNNTAGNRIDEVEKDIAAACKAIEDWTKRLKVLQENHKILNSQIREVPQRKDSAEVRQKIENVNVTNAAIRKNAEKTKLSDEAAALQEKYSELGEEIKMVEVAKAKKMAEAAMPIKGLSIREDGLAFNNIPLEQECDSKKLKICVAIAMALNPKLKVLRINVNELDSESLAIITELINDKDYQVWIEKVADENKIGFFVEDGSIVKRTEDVKTS